MDCPKCNSIKRYALEHNLTGEDLSTLFMLGIVAVHEKQDIKIGGRHDWAPEINSDNIYFKIRDYSYIGNKVVK